MVLMLRPFETRQNADKLADQPMVALLRKEVAEETDAFLKCRGTGQQVVGSTSRATPYGTISHIFQILNYKLHLVAGWSGIFSP